MYRSCPLIPSSLPVYLLNTSFKMHSFRSQLALSPPIIVIVNANAVTPSPSTWVGCPEHTLQCTQTVFHAFYTFALCHLIADMF
jgi:hypothetical protein